MVISADSVAYDTSARPLQISPKVHLGRDELQEGSPCVAQEVLFVTLRSLQEHLGGLFVESDAVQTHLVVCGPSPPHAQWSKAAFVGGGMGRENYNPTPSDPTTGSANLMSCCTV